MDRIYQPITRDIPCIYHVYTRHIPYEGHLRAHLVAHPRLEASDRDFLRIFSVLATKRPPTRGWGRLKFHSQVLISLTWLPLRVVLGPTPSAQQHSKASRCRPLYLCGIVEVVFPISLEETATGDGFDGTRTQQAGRMLPRWIGSMSRHAEMLLLQEHNIKTWG